MAPTTTLRFFAPPERELINVDARSGGSLLPTARTTGAEVVSSPGEAVAPSGGARAGVNGASSRSAALSVGAGPDGGRLSTSIALASDDVRSAGDVARLSPEGGKLSTSVDGGSTLSTGA